MMKSASQMERELRDGAIPLDRRLHDSHWFEAEFSVPAGDELISLFWKSSVPGSLAPEIAYMEMVQAWSNQGYDVSEAEELIPLGIALHAAGEKEELRGLTARLLNALKDAPKKVNHLYNDYAHIENWEDFQNAMPASRKFTPKLCWKDSYEQRIYQGWLGQLAGGSFGTAIEGYTGTQINRIYGDITSYITAPETKNDDVVYELVLLDVFERMGRRITSKEIGIEWVKQIPFGWSAEWIAIRNLNMGIFPPESGRFLNFYSDWIGAQMRGMVCGMLSPADPMEAARLAYIDGVVSHAANGVCGEIFSAVLTALSFEYNDTRKLIKDIAGFLPAGTEYAAQFDYVLRTLEESKNSDDAWLLLNHHFERYNWIHSYPNMAADMLSLWYCGGDFTAAMSLLAKSGNDVDCNGGLVGNILGVMNDVPDKWADPLGDLLETYIKGKEKLSIRELAARNARLAKKQN
ncbi:MAG: ADP-ribosylglycohydrolase family protein [Flexilinea sp.]